MDGVNAALLAGIGEQVLSPRLLDLIVRRTVALWESPEIMDPTPTKRELDQVERELSRLTDALISGGDLATVVAAIRDREDRRRALREHLEALAGRQTPKLDPQTVTRLAHERLSEWQDVLSGQVPIARQLLRKLFTERLLVTPVDATGQPIADHAAAASVKITGSATFSKFFAGIVCSKGLARPRRCQRGWRSEHPAVDSKRPCSPRESVTLPWLRHPSSLPDHSVGGRLTKKEISMFFKKAKAVRCAVCGKEIAPKERRFVEKNRLTKAERHTHVTCRKDDH